METSTVIILSFCHCYGFPNVHVACLAIVEKRIGMKLLANSAGHDQSPGHDQFLFSFFFFSNI